MATFNNPRHTAATVTASATLLRGFHTPVDATSGPKTMTLPTNAPVGVEISVEKVDSSANAVTISGTLRGVSSSVTLTTQYEARTFLSEGSGSWRPISDHRTAGSLSAAFASVKASVKGLTEPLSIAHRGGALLHPENTMEAFRAAAALGAKILDMDCQMLRDGSVAVMHDATVDRTTTATGNVGDHTAASFTNLLMDAGVFLGGAWPNTLHPPLFEDVVREFGNKVVIEAEAKAGAGEGAVMVAILQKYGVGTDAAIISSFIPNELNAARAAGYVTMLNTDTADPVATKAAGHTYVAVSSGVSNAYVTSLVAAGLKPLAYTVNRRRDRAVQLARGCVGYFSDDAVYTSGSSTALTTDPFLSGTFYPGHLPFSAADTRGTFTGGRWGLFGNVSTLTLQGWGSPITAAAGTYTLTVPITFDALGNDTGRWAGIGFGHVNDEEANVANNGTADNGYLVGVRVSGVTTVWKMINGVANTLAAGPSFTPPTAGQVRTLRVTVTPTQFSVSIDGGTPVVYTDSAYRGGNFYLGKNDNGISGLNVSFGGPGQRVTIT